jgi:hypothetical protein
VPYYFRPDLHLSCQPTIGPCLQKENEGSGRIISEILGVSQKGQVEGMKNYRLIIVAILTVFAVSAVASAADFIISPGEGRVSGFYLGDDIATVETYLRDYRLIVDADDHYVYYDYPDLGFIFYTRKSSSRVSRIKVYNSRYVTTKKVSVGSSVKDVLKGYGKGYNFSGSIESGYTLSYGSIQFGVRKGQVVNISIY